MMFFKVGERLQAGKKKLFPAKGKSLSSKMRKQRTHAKASRETHFGLIVRAAIQHRSAPTVTVLYLKIFYHRNAKSVNPIPAFFGVKSTLCRAANFGENYENPPLRRPPPRKPARRLYFPPPVC